MSSKITDLNSLVGNSLKMSLNEFVQLTERVVDLLSNERERVGNMKISGRLIEVPPQSEAIIVGDIHGDLESMTQIMGTSSFLEKVQQRGDVLLVFLGDYGDRGAYSPEVYYIALKLKESFPENVVLMRGNHEGPDDLLPSPHDLPTYLHERFGENWSNAYLKLRKLFNQLYNAVIIKDRYVLLHGGVPSQARSIDDLAFAHLNHPRESHLEEILWSDPQEGIEGTRFSPRGAGKLFGQDVTTKFLHMLNVNVLVRGHEPNDAGFKINHSGRILTLFSRKGEPYFNSQGSYLQFDLASDVKDAFQLQRFVKPL